MPLSELELINAQIRKLENRVRTLRSKDDYFSKKEIEIIRGQLASLEWQRLKASHKERG